MELDKILEILNGFSEGAFAEPARILEEAANSGARILGPREPIPTQDIKPIYERRSKRLRALGRHMPGYDDIVTLFSQHPEARWLLICVDSPENGGVILLSEDHMLSGCFAYDDRARGKPA